MCRSNSGPVTSPFAIARSRIRAVRTSETPTLARNHTNRLYMVTSSPVFLRITKALRENRRLAHAQVGRELPSPEASASPQVTERFEALQQAFTASMHRRAKAQAPNVTSYD